MATFFFDIDGTLAEHGVMIEDNKKVLQQLRKDGHTLFLCTGRPYAYAAGLFHDYVDGTIASNGRYLVYQDTCVYHQPLTIQEIKHVQDIADAQKVQLIFYGQQKQYAASLTKFWEHKLIEERKEEIQASWDMKKEPVYSFNVYYQPPITIEKVQLAFADDIILNDHFDGFSADATTRYFDKGDGIMKMLEILQRSPQDTYAFGDGANDICMFRVCAHSIAMGNGIVELKAQADYVTAHFQQQGIRKALQHYHII